MQLLSYRVASETRLGVLDGDNVIDLQRAAQAWSLFEGRDFVLPDDVKLLALPVLAHRLSMRGRAKAEDAIQDLVASVPIPPLRQH